MALDVYVGPLSRYHSGDWKTVAQVAAEAAGVPYSIVRPEGDEESASPEVVAEVVASWQKQIGQIVEANGVEPNLWEDQPSIEYVTDRPGWEGLAGLLFKFAYLLAPDLPEPRLVPDFSEVSNDPAFRRAMDEPGYLHILAACELWIPGSFEFFFESQTVAGQQLGISSLLMLNAALDEVCELWGKDRLALRSQESAQPAPDATLDEAALHGLAVFSRLAYEATERNVPMILDY
ncbi:MAG: hypothetical protein ACAH95_08370 [Fimbriimonas sp.]